MLALNVTGWTEHSSGDTPLTYKNVDTPWANTLENALRDGAFLVRAIEPNVRAAAQEGFFATGNIPTTPGEVFRGFEVPFAAIEPGSLDLTEDRGRGAPPKLPFVAVIIKAGLKPKLLRYLAGSYNRSARTLFPDFPGFREFGSQAGSGDAAEAVGSIDPDEDY